jgi:hypothetical protein
MLNGCKAYMDFYMALNGSFSRSLKLLSKTPLGGRPNTNWETMALEMLTIIDLFYFIMREDPHK